ncbi:MAG TPA: hypothetical protein VHM91_25960 [Verrucomicrobiales bacterium]|jgi:hypothetical protein|nr:hypothetical protein [Verrucomicrobiales bacterium]
MTTRRKRIFGGLLVLLLAGAACFYLYIRKRGGLGIEIEPDTRPAFTVDPAKPFVVELGRGGGMDGLEIIRVDGSGHARMQRFATRQHADGGYYYSRESASLHLPAARTKKLTEIVNSLRLTEMGRSYSRPDIADGSQWILWIQQSPFEKSIYCNNAFPADIREFAERLDHLIEQAGLFVTSWLPVQSGGFPASWWMPVPGRGEDYEERLLWHRIYQKGHVLPPNSRGEIRYPGE